MYKNNSGLVDDPPVPRTRIGLENAQPPVYLDGQVTGTGETDGGRLAVDDDGLAHHFTLVSEGAELSLDRDEGLVFMV